MLKYSLMLALIFMVGCANVPPRPTSKEMRKAQTRTYQGVDTESLIDASIRIFELSDGSAYRIGHTPSGLTVARTPLHLPFAIYDMQERWTIQTQKKEGGIAVHLTAQVAIGGTETFPRGIGAYELFFARLDYLLGRSSHWMACEEWEAMIEKNPNWFDTHGYLCSMADDDTPTGPLIVAGEG